MKEILPYIPHSELAKQAIQHKWDDWDPYKLIGSNEAELETKLSQISDYGKFTFSLGCSEWLLTRFISHFDVSNAWKYYDAWQYLEACWAFELTNDYYLPEELDDELWTGEILGPICLSLTTIINTRYGFDENNAEIDSAFAAKIVEYSLVDKKSFTQWKNIILNRLASTCPLNIEAPLGKKLPREILHNKFPYSESDYEKLINNTISQFNLRTNAYANKASN